LAVEQITNKSLTLVATDHQTGLDIVRKKYLIGMYAAFKVKPH
jgi:hypothetical protein